MAVAAHCLDDVLLSNARYCVTPPELIADRPRLHGLMVTRRQYVLRYRGNTLQHPDADGRTVNGHRKMLFALRLKDADLCERIMREHIYEARRGAVQSLFDNKED